MGAVGREENRYNSLLPLGTILMEEEDVSPAMEFFKEAHKVSPNSAVLWNNLGMYMFKKKKLVSSFCCLRRALFLDPFRWEVHVNLALVLMSNKK